MLAILCGDPYFPLMSKSEYIMSEQVIFRPSYFLDFKENQLTQNCIIKKKDN